MEDLQSINYYKHDNYQHDRFVDSDLKSIMGITVSFLQE